VNELFDMPTSFRNGGSVRNLKDADGRKVTLIGFTPGKKCKDCENFYYDQRAKVYRRCKLYPKKNWKSNFEACGSFTPEVTK